MRCLCLHPTCIPCLQLTSVLNNPEDLADQLCQDTSELSDWLALDENTDAQKLQDELCAVNTTALLEELAKQLDMQKVLDQILDLSSSDFDMGNLTDYVDSIEALLSQVSELMETPPEVDESLLELFDFARFVPVFEELLTDSTEQRRVEPEYCLTHFSCISWILLTSLDMMIM